MKFLKTIVLLTAALAAVCAACSDDDSIGFIDGTGMKFRLMFGSLNASVTLMKGFEGVYTNTVDETNKVVARYDGEAVGTSLSNAGYAAQWSETALIAGASSFRPLTEWTQDYVMFAHIPLAAVGTTTVKGVDYNLSEVILKATGKVFPADCYDKYGRSCLVTFIEYGPVGGMIRGTFSFVLVTNSSATAGMLPIVITNGIFSVKRVADNCPQLQGK